MGDLQKIIYISRVSCNGRSVVDFCIVPYHDLNLFSDFDVLLFDDLIVICSITALGSIPDRLIFRWSLHVDRTHHSEVIMSANSLTKMSCGTIQKSCGNVQKYHMMYGIFGRYHRTFL